MPESTAKKNLLSQNSDIYTPNKIVVSCEINGWMETDKKYNLNQNCKHFRVHKKLQPKYVEVTPTGIIQLKKRQQQLLQSTTKYKKLNRYLDKTRPDTQYIGSKSTDINRSKKTIQKIRLEKLPAFRINQFVIEQKNSMKIMPSIQPSKKNSRNYLKHPGMPRNQPSTSLNLLRKNKQHHSRNRQKNKKNKYNDKKNDEEKRDTIECLKQRIIRQHSLYGISRKTSNVMLNFHKQKV